VNVRDIWLLHTSNDWETGSYVTGVEPSLRVTSLLLVGAAPAKQMRAGASGKDFRSTLY
jgi:hypothetical protein